MAKHAEKQRVIKYYKEQTGITDVDMKEVAKWAVAKGLLKLPTPRDVYDILKERLSEAARIETRYDKKTGMPYRANHAYTIVQGGVQYTLWADIDEPTTTRKKMHMSAVMRRNQIVSDGVQLTLDLDHWNGIHPEEDPIKMIMDITEDIEERINAPREFKEAA